MLLKNMIAGGGAVALVLCLPLATGQIGERLYHQAVDNFHNPYIDITSERFERGYFVSDAISQITFKDVFKQALEDAGLPATWQVKHHINNGFFGVKSDSEMVINEQLAPWVTSVWGDNTQPILLTTDSFFTGNTDFAMTVAPVNYQQADLAVTSQAFALTGSADAEGMVNVDYALPMLMVKNDIGETMQLDTLAGAAKGKMLSNFWIGEQSFRLKDVQFMTTDQQQAVGLTGVDIAMSNIMDTPKEGEDIAPEAQKVSNTNKVSVDKLVTLNGEQYTDFNFDLALNDLSFSAISKLAALDTTDGTASEQAQLKEAMLALDLLVAKGAVLDLSDLSVTTEQGKVDASALLSLKPGIARASENLLSLPTKLEGNINIALPKTLVTHMPFLASKMPLLLKQKVVVEEQEQYVLSANITNGKIVFKSGLLLPLAVIPTLLMY